MGSGGLKTPVDTSTDRFRHAGWSELHPGRAPESATVVGSGRRPPMPWTKRLRHKNLADSALRTFPNPGVRHLPLRGHRASRPLELADSAPLPGNRPTAASGIGPARLVHDPSPRGPIRQRRRKRSRPGSRPGREHPSLPAAVNATGRPVRVGQPRATGRPVRVGQPRGETVAGPESDGPASDAEEDPGRHPDGAHRRPAGRLECDEQNRPADRPGQHAGDRPGRPGRVTARTSPPGSGRPAAGRRPAAAGRPASTAGSQGRSPPPRLTATP